MNPSKLEKRITKLNFEGERVDEVRVRILALEGKCTQEYFKQYFAQFPDFLSTKNRYRRGVKETTRKPPKYEQLLKKNLKN